MVVFRSIHQLKRQLVDTRNKQLCNICVESRKVCPVVSWQPGPPLALHYHDIARMLTFTQLE